MRGPCWASGQAFGQLGGSADLETGKGAFSKILEPLGCVGLRISDSQPATRKIVNTTPHRDRASIPIEIGPGEAEHFRHSPTFGEQDCNDRAIPVPVKMLDQSAGLVRGQDVPGDLLFLDALHSIYWVRHEEPVIDGEAEHLADDGQRLGHGYRCQSVTNELGLPRLQHLGSDVHDLVFAEHAEPVQRGAVLAGRCRSYAGVRFDNVE